MTRRMVDRSPRWKRDRWSLIGFLAWLVLSASAERDEGVCEGIDGDCPKCSHPVLAGEHPTATVRLSNESTLVSSAKDAEMYLKELDFKAIQSLDDPDHGLHTSLFYFCCHSLEDVLRMRDAFRSMRWSSFQVRYDTFGCNLDHNNRTVYLHAMPRNQTELFEWAKLVETTMRAHGVNINHPRKSLFHMTLARVDPEYPIDEAVGYLNSTDFGSHRLCSFDFAGETFAAYDC